MVEAVFLYRSHKICGVVMNWCNPSACRPFMRCRLVSISGEPSSMPGSRCEWISIPMADRFIAGFGVFLENRENMLQSTVKKRDRP